VQNSGSVSVEKGFINVFQYVEGNGAWIDWVKFEIPRLTVGGKGNAKYEWSGGAGDWQFRFCADSANTVYEANEDNNCTDPVAARIVPGVNQIVPSGSPPPVTSEGAEADLSLALPAFSSAETRNGKPAAGVMTLSEEITNTGDARSSPILGVWQYATGAVFTDWIRVELPALNPGKIATSKYSWRGGRGMWRFRFCVEYAAGGVRECSKAVFVDIN
jgi:hypothetical protein